METEIDRNSGQRAPFSALSGRHVNRTLLCTDSAARGLDTSNVDWIVQYDPPDNPKEYIHRLIRTARGTNKHGHALLISRPEEVNFLKYLKRAKIPLQACANRVKHCIHSEAWMVCESVIQLYGLIKDLQ